MFRVFVRVYMCVCVHTACESILHVCPCVCVSVCMCVCVSILPNSPDEKKGGWRRRRVGEERKRGRGRKREGSAYFFLTLTRTQVGGPSPKNFTAFPSVLKTGTMKLVVNQQIIFNG